MSDTKNLKTAIGETEYSASTHGLCYAHKRIYNLANYESLTLYNDIQY